MSGAYFKIQWDRRIAKYNAIRAEGRAVMVQDGRRFSVICPHSIDFIKGAKELSGTWRDKTAVWTFRIQSYRLVYDLACTVFGADKVHGLNTETKKG